jgi:hypothetical protein
MELPAPVTLVCHSLSFTESIENVDDPKKCIFHLEMDLCEAKIGAKSQRVESKWRVRQAKLL